MGNWLLDPAILKRDVQIIEIHQNTLYWYEPKVMLLFGVGALGQCSWKTDIHVRHQQNSPLSASLQIPQPCLFCIHIQAASFTFV